VCPAQRLVDQAAAHAAMASLTGDVRRIQIADPVIKTNATAAAVTFDLAPADGGESDQLPPEPSDE
jgi:hypothetical protein